MPEIEGNRGGDDTFSPAPETFGMGEMTRKAYIQAHFVDIRVTKCHAGPAVLSDPGNN
jgi:hypothetical protein